MSRLTFYRSLGLNLGMLILSLCQVPASDASRALQCFETMQVFVHFALLLFSVRSSQVLVTSSSKLQVTLLRS